ncbi:hypothetical protein [Thiopseudomonas alkaliphila]|uniref:hypothetical protein n=1 Tax=Thiopseudomonas alkaliphila TaxID=1697053 RepID=UPI002576B2D4|nr:hypothetical protein [Thiopseudomonas alkaliphila]
MSKAIHQHRLNDQGVEDKTGRIFINPKNLGLSDLSGVRLLRCAVDTVRQLYRGKIRQGVLELFEQSGMVKLGGHDFHAGRIGRDSGYQFRLQNADMGVILLIKNFNVKETDHGPHLKIEVSPHTIENHTPKNLQVMLDDLAELVLEDQQYNQCAVHIALDVQGWQPPADTVARMECRSKRVRDISGIESLEHAATASIYGKGETYMFGSAGGVQLAIYNKTLQARSTDKLDFWRSLWSQAYSDFDTPMFNPDETVWRIELRYHHSVIQQFAEGSVNTETGECIYTRSFAEFAPHLEGLWRYGFNSFKLLEQKGVYDPAWTLFAQDAQVQTGVESLLDDTEYKRYYKTASGFSGKNVELFMGNFVSLLAREKVGAKKAFDRLQEWECWPVIQEHFENKGMTERDIYKWLRDKLTERTIRWGVAV